MVRDWLGSESSEETVGRMTGLLVSSLHVYHCTHVQVMTVLLLHDGCHKMALACRAKQQYSSHALCNHSYGLCIRRQRLSVVLNSSAPFSGATLVIAMDARYNFTSRSLSAFLKSIASCGFAAIIAHLSDRSVEASIQPVNWLSWQKPHVNAFRVIS